ncbi:MAG: sulfurtransferase complex subunit TusC [Methylovulum miyakonense]|uniref:sulfurtransferase complex subunit TusC n=1 Tax=Methylovulum miyakonense TaxID=645578 RepID=UPI003BB59008
MKNYLFVLRQAAHSGAFVQEMLDIILTTAAFDQPVSLLLLDDGVFQLKSNQQPEHSGYKNTAAIFNALEMYDVTAIYTEAESLAERGLVAGDLFLPVEVLARREVAGFMRGFEVVFSG